MAESYVMEARGERRKILKRKGKRDEYREGKERKGGEKDRKREEGNSRY
jgi:hypothetical protein